MRLRFPLGIDSFEKLITSKGYYVDKTEFICELLSVPFEVNLITRPRRFGKTLTLSMLKDFFDISKDSKEHFAGLAISKDINICERWMNKWPVLFLTLKNIEGMKFESVYNQLKAMLSDYCIENSYLSESEKINLDDRQLVQRFKSKSATDEEIKNSLYTLIRIMSIHYGKPVILLIDEYDVPLSNASENGYYRQMLDIIRSFLGKALKTNEYLKFAVITGCLRIAKESIFTGTNNFVTNSITSDRFDEYIGFTENDMQKILKDSGFEDHAEEIKDWYNGYRFGSINVYCPWDVLNHLAALQVNPNKAPENYWENTSHNGIIKTFISRDKLDVQDKFETLMTGGYILVTVNDNLTYDILKADYQIADKDVEAAEKNFWNLLYMTGYLTKASDEEIKGLSLKDRQAALKIPNEEVKSIFRTAIIEWFNESVQTIDRSELFNAFWEQNTESAENIISDILFDTISYYDYKESYYHAFLAGLFTGAGFAVESNYEYGNGRPDVIVKDRKNRRVLVIEVKHAGSEEKLSEECDRAIKQIEEKKYTLKLSKGYRTVISYGIAFYDKECRIKSVC